MEKKEGDGRVLVAVLFLLLLFGIITLFVAREQQKPRSSRSESSQSTSNLYVNSRESGKPPRTQLSDGSQTDFGPYMASVQRRIKRSWFPPKNTESLRGKVIFKVHNDGTMSNLRMITTTGLVSADEAMLKAVENAAPFKALPPGAPADVDIEFTFDYNVFKHDALPKNNGSEQKN
ncbi:hypothetical protein BH11CYA1_BH11CYA1_24960 [soil metagenome]